MEEGQDYRGEATFWTGKKIYQRKPYSRGEKKRTETSQENPNGKVGDNRPGEEMQKGFSKKKKKKKPPKKGGRAPKIEEGGI